MYEFLTGRITFSGSDIESCYAAVVIGEISWPKPKSPTDAISAEAKEIVRNLL